MEILLEDVNETTVLQSKSSLQLFWSTVVTLWRKKNVGSQHTAFLPITFPDSSDLNIFSIYVPTCISLPRPVVPKSSTPATSLANLEENTKNNDWDKTVKDGPYITLCPSVICFEND